MKQQRWFASAIAILLLSACSGWAGSVVPVGPGGANVAGQVSLSGGAATAAAAYRVAPYVDMQAWPPPSLAQFAAQTGNLYYTFAFIQSYKNDRCAGAWGGTVLPSDPTNGPYFAKQLAALRSAGGDGILSFGGAAGQDLASVCATPAALAGAIEEVIDYYHFSRIDFDIEGNQPYDAASVARRSAALHLVAEHYSLGGGPVPLISYTLPVLPSGLPGHVLGVVSSALKAKVPLAIVNIMTMDYGDGAAPNPKGKMGAYAIESATSTVAQLKSIGFPLGSNPYASIGVTPMIGQNDARGEVFEPSDASQLVAWAAKNGAGRLAFWAQQRDKQCDRGVNPHASDTCSGILQKPWTFGKIFAAL